MTTTNNDPAVGRQPESTAPDFIGPRTAEALTVSESQPLARKVLDADDLVTINEAIGTLHDYGFATRLTMEALMARLDEQRRQPDEYDEAWPLLEAPALSDLIKEGEYRPNLGQRLKIGRAYSLSPGQRDVLRAQYGLTPSTYVEVIELAVFLGTRLIRRVTLRNVEHVDTEARNITGRGPGGLGPRKHLLTRFSINHFGKFLSDALEEDTKRAEEARLDKFDQRVIRLLESAKKASISHTIRATRGIASQLMALCDENRVSFPTPDNDTGPAIRELFRDVLVSRGEFNLVELVKEPSLFAVAAPKKDTKPMKSQEELLKEYAI